MIVNAAVFTCSICGEASSNICSYCTKDACSNHRCERCKRCSDCCECEFPLSAEEPRAVEEPLAPETAALAAPEPEIEFAQPEPSAWEAPASEAPATPTESNIPVFLTDAESSVFVKGSVLAKPTAPLDATDRQPLDPEHPEEPNE